MNKLKQFITNFCISTTGSLIGMLLSMKLLQNSTIIRMKDLVALLVANFLIIGSAYILYNEEINYKRENYMRCIMHYIITTMILYFTGRELEWLGLHKNQNVLPYIGIITVIYIGVILVSMNQNYQTSKKINKALTKYQRQ